MWDTELFNMLYGPNSGLQAWELNYYYSAPTFIFVAVENEINKATQQNQGENAAWDSSCNTSDGRPTQPFTLYHKNDQKSIDLIILF